MIGLTITTCKRFNLFERTIKSFKERCADIDLFDVVIFYDDSSSDVDRAQMKRMMDFLLPEKLVFYKKFEKESFKSSKRHLEIMKTWKTDIQNFNLDYVFHLEDDWFFQKDFNIRDGIEILKNHDEIALIGYSWKMKKFPSDQFIPNIINGYWEWYYNKDIQLREPLFLDEVAMEGLPESVWVKYINWPYFGFRPGIHDVKKLYGLENFNDTMESFELEFASRFADKYKSYIHPEQICYHIGEDFSAYDLNSSDR